MPALRHNFKPTSLPPGTTVDTPDVAYLQVSRNVHFQSRMGHFLHGASSAMCFETFSGARQLSSSSSRGGVFGMMATAQPMEFGINQHARTLTPSVIQGKVAGAESELVVTIQVLSGGSVVAVDWNHNEPTPPSVARRLVGTLRSSEPHRQRLRVLPTTSGEPALIQIGFSETVRTANPTASEFNKSHCIFFARTRTSQRSEWRPFFEWKLWLFLFLGKVPPAKFTNSAGVIAGTRKVRKDTLKRPAAAKLPDDAEPRPKNATGATWYQLQSKLVNSKTTNALYEVPDVPEYRELRRFPPKVQQLMALVKDVAAPVPVEVVPDVVLQQGRVEPVSENIILRAAQAANGASLKRKAPLAVGKPAKRRVGRPSKRFKAEAPPAAPRAPVCFGCHLALGAYHPPCVGSFVTSCSVVCPPPKLSALPIAPLGGGGSILAYKMSFMEISNFEVACEAACDDANFDVRRMEAAFVTPTVPDVAPSSVNLQIERIRALFHSSVRSVGAPAAKRGGGSSRLAFVWRVLGMLERGVPLFQIVDDARQIINGDRAQVALF